MDKEKDKDKGKDENKDEDIDKNNLELILQNIKAHIDQSIYSYLFILMKYIFLGDEGINQKGNGEKIKTKLKNMTKSINEKIIKREENYIKLEPVKESYSLQNFKNILNFIKYNNSMFAGDIMEGILMIILTYGFECSKTNEFGKYIYVNISKLRDVSNQDLPEWFKKGREVFKPGEMKDVKNLLNKDSYLNDNNNSINMNEVNPILKDLIIEITKSKFELITLNKGRNKTFDFITKGELNLIQFYLEIFRDMRNKNNNLTMIDKDFITNSLAYIYYYLFEETRSPPIKIIRCFLTSVYIFYQNEHSPLMKYIKPKTENDEELVGIPFSYSLKGAFVEGRFANIIISPIKIEQKISNINFGQNNIREWGLFELGKCIAMNKNIKSIMLKISLLRGYYLDFFVSGFGIYDNYSIEELNLSMNYLKEDSAFALVKLLSHLKNLKTLNLSANDFRGGPKYIFIFLKNQFQKGTSKLENLYLNNCMLDDSSYYELGELIKSKYCKLKRLSVGGNNKPILSRFLKKIKYNRDLIELNLFKCGLKNKDINDICRIISNTNIKHLNLFKNDFTLFGECLDIIFRTKIIRRKDEINKKEEENTENKDDNNNKEEKKEDKNNKEEEKNNKTKEAEKLKEAEIFKEAKKAIETKTTDTSSNKDNNKNKIKEEDYNKNIETIIKEANSNNMIDRSSSLMTLDLSNNSFYFLNSDYIYLIKDLIQDNSTISCLDLSHIFYGPYPDRSRTDKSDSYKNSIEKSLANCLKGRKNIFDKLLFKKFQKEVCIKEYEEKAEKDKLKYKKSELDKLIRDIVNTEDAIHYLYLKDLADTIITELKQNSIDTYNNLLEAEGLEKNKELNDEENEKLINKLIDYMKFIRDKDNLDRINLLLGEKNLILI